MHLTLAKATIIFPQDTETFFLDAPLEISKSAESEQIYGEVRSTELEGSVRQAVGTKTVSSEKAGLPVTIINNYSSQQPLVIATRMLSADGILYRLTEGVTVPAGGRVLTYMEADKPGEDQIVGPGKFTIPGLWAGLQDKIYGQTTETASLERRESSQLTQEDIDTALEQLMMQLETKALIELGADLPAELELTADQLVAEVTNSQTSSELGDEVSEFELTATINFTALLFDKSLLRAASENELKNRLPVGTNIIAVDNDSFSYQVAEIDTEQETSLVNTHLEALVNSSATEINFDKSELQGMTKQEASAYLADHGLAEAKVELWPFWVRHVPGLVDHIEIKVAN